MSFKVGWVFGSIAALGLVATFFILPETKGRDLEEMDAIFDVPYNPFRRMDIQFQGADDCELDLEQAVGTRAELEDV